MNKMGEWGILIVLLAGTAGGFLYWQKMATAPKRPARMRLAGGTSGFQGSTSSPLTNPLRPENAPSAAPAVTPAASAAATAMQPTGAPRASAAATSGPMSPAAGPVAASGDMAQPPAPANAGAVPIAGGAASSAAVSGLFAPKSGRDPMQSVADRNMILMYERDQKNSKLLAEEMAAEARRKNRKPPPNPAAGISLEGIMTINGRLSALINGNALFVGNRVRGARIVAITANSVTFSYKMADGKTGRFKKVMRQ